MISAKVQLTHALTQERQFVAQSGTGHSFLIDDAGGGTGPKPIELVAVGLAGCTAFDVITILRQKYHQKVTGYEVRVEADQAERPPQVFTDVRIHHAITGFDVDVPAVEQAIRLSEDIVRSGRWCRRPLPFTPPTRSCKKRPNGWPPYMQPAFREGSSFCGRLCEPVSD